MRQPAFLEAADSHTQSLPWGQFSGSLFCSPLVSCGAYLHSPPHVGPLSAWMLKTRPGSVDLSIHLPRDTQLQHIHEWGGGVETAQVGQVLPEWQTPSQALPQVQPQSKPSFCCNRNN